LSSSELKRQMNKAGILRIVEIVNNKQMKDPKSTCACHNPTKKALLFLSTKKDGNHNNKIKNEK